MHLGVVFWEKSFINFVQKCVQDMSNSNLSMVTLALSLSLQANHSDTNVAMDSKIEEDYTN